MEKSTKLIDFHAHILPCADHGSESLEMSLKQLEILEKNNVGYVVATPHFYPSNTSPEKFIEKRRRCTENLLEASTNLQIKIARGAEVLVCERMEYMKGLELLTISGTNTLLLEMPFHGWSEDLIETVRNLTKYPFNIVLAHIDRYPKNLVERLLEFDLQSQLNSEKLSSIFTCRKYMDYVNSGRVVALGSDLHGTDSSKVKKLVTAYNKIGKNNADYILQSSKKLLKGATLIKLSK